MSRIGCLIHLQKQIPKYDHNSASILIKQSFYYVSVGTYDNFKLRSITQTATNYLGIMCTDNYMWRDTCIDGSLMRIEYSSDNVVILLWRSNYFDLLPYHNLDRSAILKFVSTYYA